MPKKLKVCNWFVFIGFVGMVVSIATKFNLGTIAFFLMGITAQIAGISFMYSLNKSKKAALPN